MESINKKIKAEQGFSLIELLIVVVIIGLISTIGIPLLRKAKLKSENTAALQTTRVMSQAQINFFASNGRYARLNELNAYNNNLFGKTVLDTIQRGSFSYTLTPAYQTDADLKNNFELLMTRTLESSELPYVIKISSTGEIVQITP